ncbi:MAG: hypothetical protein QM680_01950 [Luteolibacter sp.]
MAVEILEKGHPARTIQIPISAKPIPEIGSLLLAPLAMLLLLRRQR